MQDEEDKHMFCIRNFFCIYHKISSKNEEIFLKKYEMSALKRNIEGDNDYCVF
jgi:hypothetical protein